jgi:uncharacterized protein YdeI (YjbR/CyaY-like superfamily)
VVEIPEDFQRALANAPVAKAAFEKMSFTHQKEYVNAILEAKHASTRSNRISKTIEMLNKVEKVKK